MKQRSFWKEICILLIGFLVGMFYERHVSPMKTITVDIKKDTTVVRDTLYAYTTVIPLTSGNVFAELKRQNVPHSKIVLAQSKIETGGYKSELCRKYNNLFGLRTSTEYKKYNNWKESIIDYKLRISSKYCGGSYYEFLEKLGYAENPQYTQILKQNV